MNPSETEHGKFALLFATAMVNDDFEKAKSMISCDDDLSLKEEFNEMIKYGGGPVTHVEVINEMIEWPTKKEIDIGWAYVALQGEFFSEAVAVVVSKINSALKITEVEWGRP